MTGSRARGAWYIIGLLCALQVTTYVDRLALTLLVQPIKSDLHITDTQMGLLMGPAFAFVYAVVAFPLAWGIDRLNRKWIVVAGVALWSTCTSASAFAPNFPTLFALRMGLGVGEAVLNPAVVSLIGDLFVRERRNTPAAVFGARRAVPA